MTSGRSTADDRRGEPPVLRDDGVIPAALAAGLLAADDIVQRTVEVHAMGRSHPVYRLSVDGRPIAVLKTFGPRRGDTDGEWAREAAVVDLAARVPAVARVVPPPLRWRGPEAVMAAGFVDGASAASIDGMGGPTVGPPVEWDALVAALAPPLARMHADTQRLDPVPPALHTPIPWGLRLFDGDASFDLWASPHLLRILAALAGDRVLVPAVRRARGAWRPRCLVHGDLKHDNILISRHDGGLSATFVDWEMARIGDPAWDLAAFFVRRLLADPSAGGRWTDGSTRAAAVLIAAYATEAGLPHRAVAQRLVLYSGVWLIMTTLQFVSTLPAADPSDPRLVPMLAAARTTLVEADRVTKDVIGTVEALAA